MDVKKVLEGQMARLEECAKKRCDVTSLCELTEKMVTLAEELRWFYADDDYKTRPETSGGKEESLC